MAGEYGWNRKEREKARLFVLRCQMEENKERDSKDALRRRHSSFLFLKPITAATSTEKLTINATTTSLFAPSDCANIDISFGAGVGATVSVLVGIGVAV